VTPTTSWPTATIRSADGTQITYEIAGDGPPVVIVPGALSTRTFARSTAEALVGAFTVVAYDRRGRGESGDGPTYAVAREIEDLASIIGALDGPPLLFGHSSGGTLAMRAVASGVAVRRLAVYEPPVFFEPVEPDRAEFAATIGTLLDEGRFADAVERFLRVGARTPPEIVDRAKTRPEWAAMVAMAPTLRYDLAVSGLGAPAVTGGLSESGTLSEIAVPTLVLDGELSRAEARATSERITASISGARHATLPAQRHNPSADALAPVLGEFFAASHP
jgi:pimeloyl-ACP methyl ester carboxylesterase